MARTYANKDPTSGRDWIGRTVGFSSGDGSKSIARDRRGGIDDVFLGVAGGADGFDQFTNQDAIAVCIPHATYGNDERVSAQGQHGDRARSAGKMAEERDEHAVALQGIYVSEKA